MQGMRRLCLLLVIFILGMLVGTLGKSIVVVMSGSLLILWFGFYEVKSYEKFENKKKASIKARVARNEGMKC